MQENQKQNEKILNFQDEEEMDDQIEKINETDLDMAIYLENGLPEENQIQIINKLLEITEKYQNQEFQELKTIKKYNTWLGLCYIWGRKPVKLDKTKGISILLEQNLKKQPSPLSFSALGECFRWGYGDVDVNAEISVQYFIKGAQLGDRRSQWELGNRYFWGDGVFKDLQQAHELWNLSYQQNYIHAIFYYGTNLLKGKRGYDQDQEQGMKCIQHAINKKYNKAIEYMNKYNREEKLLEQYTKEEIQQQKDKEQLQKQKNEQEFLEGSQQNNNY